MILSIMSASYVGNYISEGTASAVRRHKKPLPELSSGSGLLIMYFAAVGLVTGDCPCRLFLGAVADRSAKAVARVARGGEDIPLLA